MRQSYVSAVFSGVVVDDPLAIGHTHPDSTRFPYQNDKTHNNNLTSAPSAFLLLWPCCPLALQSSSAAASEEAICMERHVGNAMQQYRQQHAEMGQNERCKTTNEGSRTSCVVANSTVI